MPYSIKMKTSVIQQCLEKTKKARKTQAGKVAVKSAAAAALPNNLAPDLQVEWIAIAELQMPKRRVRKQLAEHVAHAALSIKNFGFVSPITVRKKVVIDGHTRVEAARELGMDKVPCIDVSQHSEAKARMLAISLNRLAERGEWDFPELKLELDDLEIDGFDLSLTFFDEKQLDIILAGDPEPAEKEEKIAALAEWQMIAV